jgi:hypothetical protein
MPTRSLVQSREEVLAAPKHLHTITTTGGNFSSKICKSGGGRREIEWGVERGNAVDLVRLGTGKKMRGKSNHPYLYLRETETTGTTGGRAPVLPVRSTAADR